mmetsp:Transcript_498/g.1186  ORF Transcript_498/g.1186 Transcript_498/m.1186 type:complete len:286 (-) Transcript_498:521-1378(-)
MEVLRAVQEDVVGRHRRQQRERRVEAHVAEAHVLLDGVVGHRRAVHAQIGHELLEFRLGRDRREKQRPKSLVVLRRQPVQGLAAAPPQPSRRDGVVQLEDHAPFLRGVLLEGFDVVRMPRAAGLGGDEMRLAVEVEPEDVAFDGLAVRVGVGKVRLVPCYVGVHGYDTPEHRRKRKEAVRPVDVLREEDVVGIFAGLVAAAGRGDVELVHAPYGFQGIPCFAELRAKEIVDDPARRQSLKGLESGLVEIRHPPVRRHVVVRTLVHAPRAAGLQIPHVLWGREFAL